MSKVNISIVFIVIIFQQFFFFNYDNELFNNNFFIIFLLDSEYSYMLFAIWYLFIATVSFSFIGFFRSYLKEYGVFILVRTSKKSIVIQKRFLKVFQLVSFFSIFQILISSIMSFTIYGYDVSFKDANKIIQAIIIYTLINIIVILLQGILELWISEKLALLIINIYILLSVMLGGFIIEGGMKKLNLFFLIPNLGMQARMNDVSYLNINFNGFMAVLVGIVLLLYGLALLRIKKIDII